MLTIFRVELQSTPKTAPLLLRVLSQFYGRRFFRDGRKREAEKYVKPCEPFSVVDVTEFLQTEFASAVDARLAVVVVVVTEHGVSAHLHNSVRVQRKAHAQ